MEQRRHYRIPARELQGFSVSVLHRETTSRGVILDVSAAGAGVRLPPATPIALDLEQRVVLRIGTHELPKPFDVHAVTRFRAEEPEGTRYGFQFDDPEEFGRQLPASLHGLFNRRFMVRVQPDPERPVFVTLWSLLGAYESPQVRVRDISGIGCSLLVEHQAARRLEGLARLRLTLRFPAQEERVDIFGRVRYRLALGAHSRFGVEFDPRTTEDFAEKQHAVITYIMRCQQESAEHQAAVERG